MFSGYSYTELCQKIVYVLQNIIVFVRIGNSVSFKIGHVKLPVKYFVFILISDKIMVYYDS
jgi:hypothetical protein